MKKIMSAKWDPMITTLPGLYIASLLPLYPIGFIFSKEDIASSCTPLLLRSTNILFSVGNLYLLYLTTYKLHYNKKNGGSVVLTALTLATFPVLYFFTWLYYTDAGSTFFSLLTYLCVLHKRHRSAAVCGLVAILFRQTNVVWVMFGAGVTAGQVILKWLQLKKKEVEAGLSDELIFSKTLSLISQSLRYNPKLLVDLVFQIFKAVWCYAVVGLIFGLFVLINKGIVVGDRSNHEPCLNFPQIYYFITICAFFSFMHMVSILKVCNFITFSVRHPIVTVTFFLFAVIFVSKFMYIHVYNLSDNRHYNFYFLSKIITRHEYAKFLLIPAYYYGFVVMWNLLQKRDLFWKLSYFICTVACIVPQRMIEFRYFIFPYLLFRLNIPMASVKLLLAELAFYFSINALTVYAYAYKPFPWPNTPLPQRFMW
ncbi:putative Dol-P-Glc:Glc(2)Man(9)GlcNAc(2)-PP-Dol alpha-1,2-glucosyltransferase isoform X3 [Pomacea canaliculata]|uniref:putative Dol-P-Glc:Glc(2)Man(9)GlcNAc(2)-PP-Dol alpha-1,2-glucosyltransferase isoform X3 n=1 Tax=Pomacea canaliculata TaxID=400727 RepID=UPI000D74007E|nr:putative Dol-P-Glc:Glc(2)Man(9)GlcNAc(2)-PP-Dol alpha-1,2-glucosyltransferase isoform X3 [Pomacea canaliculata]